VTAADNRSAPSGDRWAVVLGASTGTGAAIARRVAEDPGLHVFGVHRGHYRELATDLEHAIQGFGRRAILHVGDAGLPDQLPTCIAALRQAASPRSVALLVHSLSGASLGHFLSARNDAFHPRQFEKTFNYLAHSFAYWAQALYENDLLATNARLFGLTNVLHESLLHNCGLVAAAKAALEMYVRHLAMELGPLGHRVNLLKFGTVVTPALRTVLGEDAMRRLEDAHREMIPAGRMCTLAEVAQFVSLLLRDEAAWLNGATIDFTGGMTLRLLDLILRPD
jgi:NAD(P)-dependent dehydrogenase (short-subunit alcohol dehydrogenase family)